MSKFGSDDGSKSNGPLRDQVTVDGFRLDSSQSSWLMDRLGALDEEDKMSMANAAPAHVAHQVQMSDHDLNQNTRMPHPPSTSDHLPNSQHNHGDMKQRQIHPTPAHPPQNEDVRLHSGEQSLEHTPPLQVHSSSEPEDVHQPSPFEGQEMGGQESENALLLRQKIENLEQQLAEISDLTGDQRARYIQELSEPVGYERQGHEGRVGGDYSGEVAFEGNEDPVSQHEVYFSHHQGAEQTNHSHDGRRDVHHGHEAYRSEPYQGAHAYYDDARLTDQQGGAVHLPHSAHIHNAQAQRDFNELPQFLVPVQQNKKSRSALVGVIGGAAALLIAGGAAFTHFDHGVSDVVKSDILRRDKEPLKLSQSEATDTKLANVETDLSITKYFAVQTLQGSAGQDVPLRVDLPSDERLASAFLVVRNLPEWAKLNLGRQMNGLWMVSASQVSDLKVVIPADRQGQFSFEVDLVVNAGDAPVTKKVRADIAPYQAPKSSVVDTAVKTPPKPDSKQEVVSIDQQTEDAELIKQPEVGVKQGPLIIDQALEEKWLERGTRLLRAGDVSAARLAFSHLAEQGSGRAAFAMGMTFDPNQPSSRVVAGIKVDVERAKFWYKRALSLGHEGARDPLRQLDR